MEQRLFSHRVERPVELLVVLVGQVCRLAGPQRLNLVDHIVLVCVNIFAVLPLLLLSEENRHRHELTILVQKA